MLSSAISNHQLISHTHRPPPPPLTAHHHQHSPPTARHTPPVPAIVLICLRAVAGNLPLHETLHGARNDRAPLVADQMGVSARRVVCVCDGGACTLCCLYVCVPDYAACFCLPRCVWLIVCEPLKICSQCLCASLSLSLGPSRPRLLILVL